MNDYTLGYILEPEQLVEVSRLATAGKLKELRSYLNSISKDLLKKEIVPDYLYYWLVWRFGLSEK